MRASETILWAMLIVIVFYPMGYVLGRVWEESKSLFFGILAFAVALLIALTFYLNGN